MHDWLNNSTGPRVHLISEVSDSDFKLSIPWVTENDVSIVSYLDLEYMHFVRSVYNDQLVMLIHFMLNLVLKLNI